MKKYADRIILLSKKLKDEFVSIGFDSNRIDVLYTFHNYDGIYPQPAPCGHEISLLFVGSYDQRKGIMDLLDAFQNVDRNKAVLHLCGQLTDTQIKDRFLSMKEKLGNRVIDHGYVRNIEKKEIFEKADILLLPSYSEGMPIVIMEGLAAGCAIISTKVAAIPEIVKPENGILLAPGDVAGLAEAIGSLMENHSLLEGMKRNNYELGKQFGVKNHIEQLCAIYEKV